MTQTIAILAGGMATRLRPLSLNVPKSLVEVCKRPFIEWQLRLLAESGMTSIVLCLGHRAEEIIDFVGNGSKFGVEVEYSVEMEPLGTGGALRNAKSLLGEYFGVLYGDSFLPIEYSVIFDTYKNSSKLGMMTIYLNENQFDKSNVWLDSNGYMKYSKKNSNSEMKFIDNGFTILRRESFGKFERVDKFDLADLLEDLSFSNQIDFYEVNQRFFEIGSFEGILELSNYLESEIM